MKLVDSIRGRFGELIAAMSVRDRKLFLGLVITVQVVVLVGVFWFARGLLGDARSRVADREETLALVRVLASDQAEASAQVTSIEAELERNATQDLPSFIEKSAQKIGISTNLAGVREKGSPTTEGTLEETTYGVELTKVSLQQLVDFLYEIETTRYPLKVRSMKTKTQTTAGIKMLNVTLEVSAFRLVAAAATTP